MLAFLYSEFGCVLHCIWCFNSCSIYSISTPALCVDSSFRIIQYVGSILFVIFVASNLVDNKTDNSNASFFSYFSKKLFLILVLFNFENWTWAVNSRAIWYLFGRGWTKTKLKSFSFQLKLKSQFDVINQMKSNSWQPQQNSTIYLVIIWADVNTKSFGKIKYWQASV